MPRTARQPDSSLESACKSGSSTRHGPHQVAQKLTNTGRPRNDSSATGLPPRSDRTNEGADALPGEEAPEYTTADVRTYASAAMPTATSERRNLLTPSP